MRQTTSVTTKVPSIVIIQGAYDKFCVPSGTVGPEAPCTVYRDDQNAVTFCLVTVGQYAAFATAPPVEEWLKFHRLVADWRTERGASSSITEAALCPAYQSIIGMGATAVPFILAQLESEGDEADQWFWALKAITGASPVRDEDRGYYVRMAESWIQWGKNEGYAW